MKLSSRKEKQEPFRHLLSSPLASPQPSSLRRTSQRNNKDHSNASKSNQENIDPMHNKDLTGDLKMQDCQKMSLLFEGLTFFLEIFENEMSISEPFISQIMEQGGTIVKQLTRNTNYYVFQNGRVKTLKKIAQNADFINVKLVSPDWLHQCLSSQQLLNPLDFKPDNYETLLSQVESKSLQDKKPIDKKRKSPLPVIDQTFKQTSPMKSKRKMKASEKKQSARKKQNIEQQSQLTFGGHALNQTIANISDLDQSIFDRSELDKTIQQLQQERFFMKEFAKDLKKFTKQQQQLSSQPTTQPHHPTNINPTQLFSDVALLGDDQQPLLLSQQVHQKPKREMKYMSKNQLLDSYIEGEIDTADFIQHMGTKMNEKKGHKHMSKHGNIGGGMKRLSEIFKPSQTQRPQASQDTDKENNPNVSIMNRTIITLQDFLVDIDDDPSPNDISTHQKQAIPALKQSSISFNKQQNPLNPSQKPLQSVYNYNPQTLFLNQLIRVDDQLGPQMRLAKSSTFGPSKAKNRGKQDLVLDIKENNLFIPRNVSMRRTQSMHIPLSTRDKVQSLELIQNEADIDENKIMIDSSAINQKNKNQGMSRSAKKASKSQTKKKKVCERNTQPTRVMPQRGCKLNVKYSEEEEEYQKQEKYYIEKMINKKRFNL